MGNHIFFVCLFVWSMVTFPLLYMFGYIWNDISCLGLANSFNVIFTFRHSFVHFWDIRMSGNFFFVLIKISNLSKPYFWFMEYLFFRKLFASFFFISIIKAPILNSFFLLVGFVPRLKTKIWNKKKQFYYHRFVLTQLRDCKTRSWPNILFYCGWFW